MSKYDVHVYPVVRVLVPNIEADSPEEACRAAEVAIDWNQLFDRQISQHMVEFADDFVGFLVDEDGNTEHQRSTHYDAEYHPL